MSPIDDISIQKVADACKCSNLRARTLLTTQCGNVEEAIKLNSYLQSQKSMKELPDETETNAKGGEQHPRKIPNAPPGDGTNRKPPPIPRRPARKGTGTAPTSLNPKSAAENNSKGTTRSDAGSIQGSRKGDRDSDGGSKQDHHDSGNDTAAESPYSPSESDDRKPHCIPAAESEDEQVTRMANEPSAPEDSDVDSDYVSVETDTTSGGEATPEELSLPPRDWDFVLPVVDPPAQFIPGGPEGTSPFSLEELVGAMQHGASYQQIRAYLCHQDEALTKHMIKTGRVEGFPVMFYAVGTNNEWIIREFARFDGDVNSVYGEEKIPLLAFAIANCENVQSETTISVATLLSLGATVDVIPKAFYSPFCVDLPDNGPDEDRMPDLVDDNKRWCVAEVARHKLAKTLNLTQRYHIEKSTKVKTPSSRARQIAKLGSAEPLLGIPYFLIGQNAAASLVIDHLLSYMAQGLGRRKKRPLIMVFAGPSGHGKTELARQLGHLLSLELEVVDCTTFKREDELFGPRAPYQGSLQGSPLNNFLARKSGQPGIVFLDEFEKTISSIHNALLIPFDKGEYEDRRNRTMVDCSRMVWVLATNAIDNQIKAFCEEHKAILLTDCDHPDRPDSIKKLSKVIKKEFKQQFGPPITGRVSAFIPFLPFSRGEQAVGAHKYLLEFARELRQPISLQPGHESLIGNMTLHIRRDASVCRLIAEEGYDEDLGIRSLIAAVRENAQAPIFRAYLDVDADIEEGGQMTKCLIDVRSGEVVATLIVAKDDQGE